MMGRRRNGACPERKKGFFEARQTVVERVFEPILFLLFSGKGETDGIFFLLLQKENAWQKKKETGETFRMVSPDPFYRPEPCSGLAAYGSRKCTIEFVGADEGIGPYDRCGGDLDEDEKSSRWELSGIGFEGRFDVVDIILCDLSWMQDLDARAEAGEPGEKLR